MVDIPELIDQLIAEHKVLSEKTGNIENAMNDARLISILTKARDTFVPGRFDQVEKLKILEEQLNSIEVWLNKHFNREETVLLKAVENYGDMQLTDSLNKLLFEHNDLRYRVAHSKMRVAELLGNTLHRHVWDASAHDARSYLSHTRSLLETHAGMENKLFTEIRHKIRVTPK